MAIRATLQTALRFCGALAISLAMASPSIVIGSPTEFGHWKTSLDIWHKKNKTSWKIPKARDAAFTPDGKSAVVALLNGTVELIRLSDQKKLAVFDMSLAQDDDFTRPVCLSFSPDGSRLAIGFWNGKTILMVDIVGQKILRRIKVPFFPRKIRFSPKGRFLLIARSATQNGWNRVFNLMAGKAIFRSPVQVPLTFTREDRYFFHVASQNRQWWIWMREGASGRPLKTIKLGIPYPPRLLRSLRDHRVLIVTGGLFYLTDRFLSEVLTKTPTMGHGNRQILPTADGRYIISSDEKRCSLYRLHDGRWKNIQLPTGSRPLSAYPRGNAFLFFNPRENSVAIHRFSTRDSGWLR